MTGSDAFGPNLRRMRLRRGISVHELSSRTNVSVELWEAMETNDLSRWPTGLYARAYIREYAEVVGADADATVDEFCRLFPQGDRRAEAIVRGHAELLGHPLTWSDDLPAALAGDDRRVASRADTPNVPRWMEARRLRGTAATLDVAAVLLVGWGVSRVAPIDFWPTLAVTTLIYHGVSFAALGCSPAGWAIDAYAAAHPHFRRAGDVPFFRRLAAMRKDHGPA
jgi:transcriptional regulator with XRE-family HTH domain